MRIQKLALSTLLACSIPGTVAAQTAAAPTTATKLSPAEETHLLELGKKYVRFLLSGQADSLATGYDSEALKAMGGVDGIKGHMAELKDHVGGELSVVVEKMTLRNGMPQFWHEGNFLAFTDEAVVIRFVFDPKTSKIIGVGMNPKSKSPAPDGM